MIFLIINKNYEIIPESILTLIHSIANSEYKISDVIQMDLEDIKVQKPELFMRFFKIPTFIIISKYDWVEGKLSNYYIIPEEIIYSGNSEKIKGELENAKNQNCDLYHETRILLNKLKTEYHLLVADDNKGEIEKMNRLLKGFLSRND